MGYTAAMQNAPRQTSEPADWLRGAAERMARGVRDRHSPWRLFALATIGDDGPEARTVALRGLERDTMTVEFWTDRRSFKVVTLDRGAAALFWDPRWHVQLRLAGTVEVSGTDDGATARLFDGLSDEAVRNYATLSGPGSLPGTHDADERGERTLARDNFLRCRIVPERGDLVHLGRERHSRFRYRFDPFAAVEVVP